MLSRLKSLLLQNWIFYLAGLALVFGLKLFYSRAGTRELDWILAPTAMWVRILSGIPFEKISEVGYVNRSIRFIIAPSCSGMQFLIIAIATLVFSFVHRMRTTAGKWCWMAVSVVGSCVLTIFINGIRIVLSIHIPGYLEQAGVRLGWLTPEKLHTITGIVVYFTALFIIYLLAESISQKAAGKPTATVLLKYVPPVFWYFAITLGLPLLNQAGRNDDGAFTEYAALIMAVCGGILVMFLLISVLGKYWGRRKEMS